MRPKYPYTAKFHLPGSSDKSLWFVFELAGPAGSWLVFLNGSRGRRRLSPVPHGWQRLGPEGLAALLERATPVPLSPPSGSRSRFHPAMAGVVDEYQQQIAHEQSLFLKEMLEQAHEMIRVLLNELEWTNAELCALNEELQRMTSLLEAVSAAGGGRAEGS